MSEFGCKNVYYCHTAQDILLIFTLADLDFSSHFGRSGKNSNIILAHV